MGTARPAGDPPGYPREYETELTLTDGRRVRVRPIRPQDSAELAEAIRTADPQTLRSRFLGAAPPVTPELLRSLTEIDYVHRFALVAFGGEEGVAVARYIAPGDPPREAEVAIAVSPGWRRVGLATQLVRLLGRRAVECGIESFTAMYWSQNRPVAELVDDARSRVLIADGVAEMRARLSDNGTYPEAADQPPAARRRIRRRPAPPT